ncbi:hypothetical protein [Planobispora takensis]|uniref:Uncharacterized protein n=1 Tax=Planobispora takensis TaxID=1367882 RepID=A0A8J3T708_9ACTN|nr:hypothetical protein [Planobispora takensis]GII06080.1 hypothetical protein Pta02_80880 [Planobispora takensis]
MGAAVRAPQPAAADAPYCHTFSVRLVRAYGRVRCENRECVDSEGKRPVGGIDKT